MTALDGSPAEYPDLYFDVERRLLPLLGDKDFSIALDRYDPLAFGNCVITLRSKDFLVRVISDKGQVFIDIGLSSSPQTLWSLGVLVAFVERSPDLPRLVALDEEVSVLSEHRDCLLDKSLLRDRAAELLKFQKEWSDRRWARLRRPPS